MIVNPVVQGGGSVETVTVTLTHTTHFTGDVNATFYYFDGTEVKQIPAPSSYGDQETISIAKNSFLIGYFTCITEFSDGSANEIMNYNNTCTAYFVTESFTGDCS